MSKISNAVADMNSENVLRKDETVTNFMGGDSYTVDPITRLRMVTASSIFGEPSYYRGAELGGKSKAPHVMSRAIRAYGRSEAMQLVRKYDIFGVLDAKDTVSLMEEIIDSALDYDFKATLDWAVELRNEFYIRLNPQVIMVRAAIHPKRKQFTAEFNGAFAAINKQVMFRADDAMSQMAYYLYKNNGKKNDIPSVIKRSWASRLGSLSRYEVAKYKNHEIGMINAVRICHANSDVLDELMQNGTVEVEQGQKTWENLRSEGKSWAEIFNTVKMGHMALLRNLRGFLTEVEDRDLAVKYMESLKSGVLKGKQFPFRYYTAYQMIGKARGEIHFAQLALDTLEECIDISIENMPKLKGKTMCLSDNSGSAWGGLTTEYGSVVVAEIDNLSSVITAMRSDEGYVGKFGDILRVYPISKRRGALEQAREICENNSNDVGGGTEGGIWEFFANAIDKKEHWDNIFIYSDQQAGTGGLYGTSAQNRAYRSRGYECDGNMINVFKLVLDYRKSVYQKVNVFSVQTAGYDNMVVPNYAYRINLMYGWTGKEIVFADAIIREWDNADAQRKQSRAGKQKPKAQPKAEAKTKTKPKAGESKQPNGVKTTKATSTAKPRARKGSSK